MTPQELLRHGDTGQPWPSHGGAVFADLATAYRSALAVRALRIARGEIPRGYKVGFTNRTIWPRYQVFAPIWGSMWNTTFAYCDGVGTVSLAVCASRASNPRRCSASRPCRAPMRALKTCSKPWTG